MVALFNGLSSSFRTRVPLTRKGRLSFPMGSYFSINCYSDGPRHGCERARALVDDPPVLIILRQLKEPPT